MFEDKFPEIIPIYAIGGYKDYYYGPLVESAGLLIFDLHYFMPGLILKLARKTNADKLFAFKELPKFFDVLERSNKISDILDITDLNFLNQKILKGEGKRIILTGEALQAKRITHRRSI